MTNWAQNWVTFYGEETQLKQVNDMFKAMENKEKLSEEGQIPPFMEKPEQDYFFEICSDEIDTISYTTKWSPNVDDLVVIANHFNLNFVSTYEETGSNIFGKAIFTAGNSEAKKYDLKKDDFDLYEFDEKADTYIFEGEKYECESDILQIIFERKFNQNY